LLWQTQKNFWIDDGECEMKGKKNQYSLYLDVIQEAVDLMKKYPDDPTVLREQVSVIKRSLEDLVRKTFAK
jgi:hypothetical protein